MSIERKANRHSRFKWWHGVLFYAGVQTVEWGLRLAVRAISEKSGPEDDREYYRRQRLPVFAPPGLAFPIAWSINSAASLAGALHVLNLRSQNRDARRFLALQGVAWLLYVTFNTAYFELRSPINAAAVTFAYSGLTVASIGCARRMKDWLTVFSLMPTAVWLTLANPVAIAVASWNRDDFWNVGPFAIPRKHLVK